MPRRLLVLAATLALVAAVPTASHAAGWKTITTPSGGNSDQVALLRTADGVLHVAWHHRTGPSSYDMLHTAIAPNGAVGATTPIASGWAILNNAALVAVPGGIRAFWGGMRSTDPTETNVELNTALSVDGGASWALQPGSVVPPGGQPAASPVAAAVRSDGTPLQAWAGTLGTWVHAGLTPATPNHDFQAPLGTYGYDPGLAVDATDVVTLAWYSNATGHLGLHAQRVAADGSPIAAAMRMPSTANMSVGMLGRTPIVARAGGGTYVAYATGYPSINRVRLWRVGSATTRLIAATNGLSGATTTLAAAPDGRLWVVWKNVVNFKPRVFAKRSNKAGTIFGATVSGGAPTGATTLYRLDASSTARAVDVFGSFTIGTSAEVATRYRRLLPGLTLSASPRRLVAGRATNVRFSVRDAGDPVAGARVRVGAVSGTTSATGRVTLRLTLNGRSLSATATKAGYVRGRARLSRR